jgi:hypothetical protein
VDRHRTSVSVMIVRLHSQMRPRLIIVVARGVVHSRLRPRMIIVVVGGERRSKRQTDDRRCRGKNLRHSESSLILKLAHKAYVKLNAPCPQLRSQSCCGATCGAILYRPVAKRLSEETQRSLREISAAPEAQGFVAKSGKPFAADVVSGMLAVSWADVERGVSAYEARKQAA